MVVYIDGSRNDAGQVGGGWSLVYEGNRRGEQGCERGCHGMGWRGCRNAPGIANDAECGPPVADRLHDGDGGGGMGCAVEARTYS